MGFGILRSGGRTTASHRKDQSQKQTRKNDLDAIRERIGYWHDDSLAPNRLLKEEIVIFIQFQ
jgi:hypothetical protein